MTVSELQDAGFIFARVTDGHEPRERQNNYFDYPPNTVSPTGQLAAYRRDVGAIRVLGTDDSPAVEFLCRFPTLFIRAGELFVAAYSGCRRDLESVKNSGRILPHYHLLTDGFLCSGRLMRYEGGYVSVETEGQLAPLPDELRSILEVGGRLQSFHNA